MTRTINSLTMKKFILYIGMCVTLLLAACDDLGDLNVDPTQSSPETFDPNYFLSSSQWQYLDGTMGYNGPTLFQSGWAQIWASTSTGAANYYSNMDKYVASGSTNDYMGRSWNGCYWSATIANEILSLTAGKEQYTNLAAVAKIMQILNVQYVTDMYGDCPYTEAFQIKTTNETTPAYDKQNELYPLLLSELDAAIAKLDESKPKPTADLIYKGDIGKWKRFGNSLMLRMAMRLVKVDAATAKTYAEKAATGGTMSAVSDDAYIVCDNSNGYRNDYARDLITPADFYQVRWSKRMIDYLQDNNDPRLGAVAEVPQAGLTANQTVGLAGDNDPDNQIGLPNGYDLGGSTTDISNSPDYPGGTGSGADFTAIGRYSRPRTTVYGNLSGPVFIFTYAQSELLMAEALVRGFSVGGSAAAHYHNAVSAGVQSLTPFGAAATISATTAENFADNSPLDVSTTENSIKMINEQYWATSGLQLNFVDAWNNWKRTGYPELTAINYFGNFSSGQIPRRQPYPTSEGTINAASYQAAVARLTGGDKWNARVWWDAAD